MDTVSINNSSLYGSKYFISIHDDSTRFGWILFIKSKDQVFNAFLSWYTIIKISFLAYQLNIYVRIIVRNWKMIYTMTSLYLMNLNKMVE